MKKNQVSFFLVLSVFFGLLLPSSAIIQAAEQDTKWANEKMNALKKTWRSLKNCIRKQECTKQDYALMTAGVLGVLTVIGGMVVVAYKGYQRPKSAFQTISVAPDLKKELAEKVAFKNEPAFKNLLSVYLNNESIMRQRIDERMKLLQKEVSEGIVTREHVETVTKELNKELLDQPIHSDGNLQDYIELNIIMLSTTKPSFESIVREWLEGLQLKSD